MKTCLIVTGGSIDLTFAGSFLTTIEISGIIAVDAGLEAVQALKLVPDMIVGDFDTVNPAVLENFRKQKGITWDIHEPEKDETDTELAVQKALETDCDEILILGATGGRMDHSLGNLHLLYLCQKRGVNACLLDPYNKIYLLDSGKEFSRQKLWGKYISFLPLTWEVKGITLEGFKYPLYKKDISIGTSLCISNELICDKGSLAMDEGILVCVESHD